MKKNIVPVVMTIILTGCSGNYMKGEKTGLTLQCNSRAAEDARTDQNDILPYYPFFIKI